MLHTIRYDDAKSRLRDLMDAAFRGETVLIAKDDQLVIQLSPVKQVHRPRQFGSAKGLIHMSDDFDAPLEDFKEYEK